MDKIDFITNGNESMFSMLINQSVERHNTAGYIVKDVIFQTLAATEQSIKCYNCLVHYTKKPDAKN